MAREYKYSVESFYTPRPVIVRASSPGEAAARYLKTWPKNDIRRISKVAWEAPARKIGRKFEGQIEQERQAYQDAVKELTNA